MRNEIFLRGENCGNKEREKIAEYKCPKCGKQSNDAALFFMRFWRKREIRQCDKCDYVYSVSLKTKECVA